MHDDGTVFLNSCVNRSCGVGPGQRGRSPTSSATSTTTRTTSRSTPIRTRSGGGCATRRRSTTTRSTTSSRVEPLRRRRAGARRLGDVQLGARARSSSSSRRTSRCRPASFIFEDPPDPRRPPRPAVAGVHAEEDERDRAEGPRVLRRAALDPLVGAGRVRLHRRPRRRRCRCARSACCSASPRQDQEAIRDQIDEGLRLEAGEPTIPSSTASTGRRRGLRATTSTGGPSTRPTTS